MRKQRLRFTLNGHAESAEVAPRDRLLDALRVNLGLTGAKEGCGTGDCGSCTVLVDGKAVNSCMMLALQAEGREVLTIEGLGKPGDLHPVQQALAERGGIQCGFCTPGMALSLKGLLDRNPHPEEADIRVAISSNLCRCTGYGKIIDAAKAVIEGTAASDNGGGAVGTRMTRVDAVEKVTGRALYAEDIQLPRMLYGALVRSPHAHGQIRAIDASAALNLPGVKAVITGRDLEMGYFGYELQDQRVFALDKARFRGDPIAAVAAETPDLAREAASLVKVEWQTLPAVFDPEEALAADAPLVHEDATAYKLDWETERGGNLCYRIQLEDGDVEQGFAEAERIVEGTYHTPVAHAGAIEPHSATAMVEASGRIAIWTSTQKPFGLRAYLAQALKRPVSDFKIVPTHIGGGLRRQALPLSRALRGVAGGALRPAGADDPDPRRGNGIPPVAPSLQGGVQDRRQKRRDSDGPADPHPVQHRRLRRLRPQHGGPGLADGHRPLPLPECGPHGKRGLHQHGAKTAPYAARRGRKWRSRWRPTLTRWRGPSAWTA